MAGAAPVCKIEQESEWYVAAVIRQRSRDLNSAAKERKSDREQIRAIRTRQRALGRELRRIYDDVVREAVPAEILELLHKIDDSGEGGSGGSGVSDT